MADEKACLHCGQTKAQIKRDETICGIEGGYEYRELEEEWPRHRWADWRDGELDRMGIVPEAYDRYRRESVMTMQYVACADTQRGHVYPTKEDAQFGIPEDQCWACGHRKADEASEADDCAACDATLVSCSYHESCCSDCTHGANFPPVPESSGSGAGAR